MITKRTLEKWRKEALKELASYKGPTRDEDEILIQQLSNRILKLTQELLDQHLLNKE